MRSGRRKKHTSRRKTYSSWESSTAVPAEKSSPEDTKQENTAGRTYCVMAMPPAGCTETASAICSGAAAVPAVRSPYRTEDTEWVPAAGRLRGMVRLVVGLLLTALIMSSPLWLTTDELLPVMKQLGASSASMQLSADEGEWGIVEGETVQPEPTTAPSQTTTTSQTEATTAPTTTTTAQNDEGLLPVSEEKIGGSGTRVGDIYVKNSTGYSPDFASLLKKRADCKIKLNAGYQVLIVHTHTTECYAQRDDGLYDPDYSPRTTDCDSSVVAVGEVLAQQLEAVGIRTLHAKEVHDYPRYNGSYDRALDTIEKYLKEYPSIEMVLDVHRDAITYEDGTKLKPTAEIDGRKAAQVMMITGCDAGGSLYFPQWEKNLCMALQIQQAGQKRYDGLMRPLSFAPYRYNMHMTPNSLLVEFGTDANTLEEALYSAELFGQAAAEVLLEYVVG